MICFARFATAFESIRFYLFGVHSSRIHAMPVNERKKYSSIHIKRQLSRLSVYDEILSSEWNDIAARYSTTIRSKNDRVSNVCCCFFFHPFYWHASKQLGTSRWTAMNTIIYSNESHDTFA